MRQTAILLTLLLITLTGRAADYTVSISYDGETATVSIPSELSSYVTCTTGSSSHVKLTQASTVGDDTTGEIIYNLEGSSSDGEFYLEGSYKATIQLNGLTLTNPSGPALNIQNGKRIKVSAKSGTTSTLTDGANDDYNGCVHSKGHTEFAGKGTLNISGSAKHAVYSKEYVEIKNLTLNITSAVKDGIHCQEYLLMESGNVTISNTGDDGIQVEMDGTASTGTTADHEDEDTGNFYLEGGTLTISGYGGKAIKADGTIAISGGTHNYAASDTQQEAATAISSISQDGGEALSLSEADAIYTLNGQAVDKDSLAKGIYIIRKGNKTSKIIIR